MRKSFKFLSKQKVIITFITLLSVLTVSAKSYKWKFRGNYEVQVVRVAQEGTKFYKAWGVAGSPDKAIVQALQDAVAATLFTGVPGNDIAGNVPPICGNADAYQQHKEYFDKFFKKGAFLDYVVNVNKNYPTGENNIAVKGGRRVGVYVQIMYDNLRKKLETDGIIKSINDYF